MGTALEVFGFEDPSLSRVKGGELSSSKTIYTKRPLKF